MDNQSEENFINLNCTVKVFSEKNKNYWKKCQTLERIAMNMKITNFQELDVSKSRIRRPRYSTMVLINRVGGH